MKCQCADPGCPKHTGISHCSFTAKTWLYRVDMEDESGTRMCSGCASDALESGLFSLYSTNDHAQMEGDENDID